MNIRYKLTHQTLTTHNNTQWVLNEWKETSGNNGLCTNAWLHCYSDPRLAIIFNTLHARIENPKLFEIEVNGKHLNDHGIKEGWTKMRLVKEIEPPPISNTQAVAFSILCAKKVYKKHPFQKWAKEWLNGTHRHPDPNLKLWQKQEKSFLMNGIVNEFNFKAANKAVAASKSMKVANIHNNETITDIYGIHYVDGFPVDYDFLRKQLYYAALTAHYVIESTIRNVNFIKIIDQAMTIK